MATRSFGPAKPKRGGASSDKLDLAVAQARKEQDERMQGYRELSLKLHPWICGRCGKEFTRENLHLLTVHHKDGNHDNNPLDGSNWENLCIYCHDAEHSRYQDYLAGAQAPNTQPGAAKNAATHNPFASLKDLLKPKE
jgi:5-methylcytosine-specific restriction endonuclease McrA